MIKQIFKAVLLGLLLGAALFIMPFFLLKFFLFFMLIGAFFKLLWGGKRRRGWGPQYQFAFADKIRSMNEDEYNSFKAKMQSNACGYHYHSCGNGYKTSAEKTENKNEVTND